MEWGLCVIGIEKIQDGGYRSKRPTSPGTDRWASFPYSRGDLVGCDVSTCPVLTPHIEDRIVKDHRKLGALTEAELITCLNKAETAGSVEELFGCRPRLSPKGGSAVFVDPDSACRSICGCDIRSVSFTFRFFPPKIRVALALKSGDTLNSLPLIDRDWHVFIERIVGATGDQHDLSARLDKFFNSFIEKQITNSSHRFARIGLSRPSWDGRCWLMLDSLFPLPRPEWREPFG